MLRNYDTKQIRSPIPQVKGLAAPKRAMFLNTKQMLRDMFRVFRSDWYEKKLSKLDGSEKARVEKFEQELKTQPLSGKPLGYEFFREKKFDGKRLLFLVYSEHEVVFLVTIVDKKVQQQIINMIKTKLDVYRELIEKLVRGLKSP